MISQRPQPAPANLEALGKTSTRLGELVSAEEWDRFLESTPQGQFQQSAMWGDFKASMGWACCRLVQREESGLIGLGCQMLIKTIRGFRIGYISKGPVMGKDLSSDLGPYWSWLRMMVRELRLSALLIHPPDEDHDWVKVLLLDGCVPANRLGIITSTLRVPLPSTAGALEEGYLRRTQQAIRQAARRGVRVRQVGAAEARTCFGLIQETCGRKGLRPNPPTAASFETMYRACASRNCARLTVAELDRTPVATTFSIKFGRQMTIWKKGATRDSFPVHAMELLYHDAMSWGCAQGLVSCDFGGVSHDMAETLLTRGVLSQSQKASQDFFNYKFGGKPFLLPEPVLYVPNPALRLGVKAALRHAGIQRMLKAMLT